MKNLLRSVGCKRRGGMFASIDHGTHVQSFWSYAVWPIWHALIGGLALGGFCIWFALVVTGNW